MSVFKIQGGNRLQGDFYPQGAKNEALQVISAVLLTKEKVTISNVPDIIDVNKLINILDGLGVDITKREKGVFVFQATKINIDFLKSDNYKVYASSLRGSVLLLGALLSRLKMAKLPNPGGDKIGRRPLDTHFSGFEKLGAKITFNPEHAVYDISGENLHGSYILLTEPSVTGTANILMAAVKANGTTVIYNAACEPYIQQLCKMLISMGANITGIGSNLLTIKGVKSLNGCKHTILPDMIEIGSIIGLSAMTNSDITIKNCRVDMLGQIPDAFRKFGVLLEIKNDCIHIIPRDHYKIDTLINGSLLTIADGPWPGITPDLLSIFIVVAIQAQGSVLIHQKMFESRLFFVDKLIDMGAQIILCDPHRATVIGLDKKVPLRGISMTSPDIRAGVALLIAALAAEGTSTIENVIQIDRGYENIDQRLINIGANIKRIN